MSAFADRIMQQARDPAGLEALLLSADGLADMRLLTTHAFDFGLSELSVVRGMDVRALRTQRPVLPLLHWEGTAQELFTSTVNYTARGVVETTGSPLWIDIEADLRIEVALELEPQQVEEVAIAVIPRFASLDDFRATFDFIDADAFLSRRGIETLEQLHRDAAYAAAEIRLATPPAFDPDDPAGHRSYVVPLALILRDAPDLVAILRDLRRLSRTLDARTAFGARSSDGVEQRAAAALAVVLPEASLADPATEAPEIRNFFAGEGILALFAA